MTVRRSLVLVLSYVVGNVVCLHTPSSSGSSSTNTTSSRYLSSNSSSTAVSSLSSFSTYSRLLASSSSSTSSSLSSTLVSFGTSSSSSSSVSPLSTSTAPSLSTSQSNQVNELTTSFGPNRFANAGPTTTSSSSLANSTASADHSHLVSGIFPPEQYASIGSSGVRSSQRPPVNALKQASLSANGTSPPSGPGPTGSRVFSEIYAPNSITKVPAPLSIGPDGPIFGVNATLPPDYASGALSLSYDMGVCSMSPGFDGYNAKSCSCVNRIGKWYHDFATGTITTTSCRSTYDWHYATDVQLLGCYPTTITQLAQPYTAPTDCCNKCEMQGKAVRLLYWPKQDPTRILKDNATVTALPQPGASSGIVSDGFTFVSPSVYVVYTSLSASASCVARAASWIPVGSTYLRITRAYAPEALSTARCLAKNAGAVLGICVFPKGSEPDAEHCYTGIDNGWEAINYDELANPPPASEMWSRKSSCFPDQPGFTMDMDFARSLFLKPQLAYPPDVSDIDPVWKTWGRSTCTAVDLGVADPPHALGQASALGPAQAPGGSVYNGGEAPISDFFTDRPALVAPVTDEASHSTQPTPPAKPGDHAPNPQITPTPSPKPSFQQPDSDPPVQDPSSKDNHPTGGDPAASKGDQSINDDPAELKDTHPSGGNPVASNGHPAEKQNPPAQQSPSPANKPEQKLNSVNSNFAPAPVPAPIVLNPEKPSHAATAQNPGIGQAINEQFNQPSGHDTQDAPPNPAPSAKVPLIPAIPSVHVDNRPVFQQPDKNIIVGGKTITPGAQSEVAGHVVSNGVDNVVVDGNTQTISPTPPPSLPSIKNAPVQKFQNGNLIVGSLTVSPGAQTTIAGHAISNGPSQVVVKGQTFAAGSATTPILVNNQIVHMTNGGLEIGSQTLIPGSLVTLSGHVVDYANPSQVAVDGTTHSLVPIASTQPFVIAGQTLSRGSDGAVIIAGLTVAASGTASIAGHTFSLVGSSSVIEDSQTYSLPQPSNAYVVQQTPSPSVLPLTLSNGLVVTPEAAAASAAVMTVDGTAFTVAPTGFTIGSMTVAPGGLAVTIANSVVVSLDPSAHLQVGSSSVDLGALLSQPPSATAVVPSTQSISPGPLPTATPATESEPGLATGTSSVLPFVGSGGASRVITAATMTMAQKWVVGCGTLLTVLLSSGL